MCCPFPQWVSLVATWQLFLKKKNDYTRFKVNLAIYNERESKLLFKGNSSGREIGTQNFGNISSVFSTFLPKLSWLHKHLYQNTLKFWHAKLIDPF